MTTANQRLIEMVMIGLGKGLGLGFCSRVEQFLDTNIIQAHRVRGIGTNANQWLNVSDWLT